MLMRITALHYVAGLIVSPGGTITEAAPILHWAIGKRWFAVKKYFYKKRFTCEQLEDKSQNGEYTNG